MPAVVVGTSDPYTESGDGQISSTEGNGYFCRFYVAATKFIPVGKKEFHPQLRVIAEYDAKDVAVGATYLLFNHLHAQVELQKMKYFTGGLTYKIYLK